VITPEERRAAARALVTAEPEPPDRPGDTGQPTGMVGWLRRLCRVAVRCVPATGSGVSGMTAGGVQGVVATSEPSWAALEETQFALGEGPCLQMFDQRRPDLEPAVGAATAGRWPAYCAAVRSHGVRAVFAFPLQMGAVRLGMLTVSRTSPGDLSITSLAQVLTLAEIAVETLLDGQEHAEGDRPEDTLDRALDSQFAVYRAQGMTMVDLGVSPRDAMVRLRAHACAQDRSLRDVAADVVKGGLRLERDVP